MKESKIEGYLVEEVLKLGGVAVKFVCTYFTGMPDRLVLLPGGRIFFVECKAPGKKLRTYSRQPYVKRLLTKLGFKVWVIDTYEAVDEFINYTMIN